MSELLARIRDVIIERGYSVKLTEFPDCYEMKIEHGPCSVMLIFDNNDSHPVMFRKVRDAVSTILRQQTNFMNHQFEGWL